jgi:hypothetical protein
MVEGSRIPVHYSNSQAYLTICRVAIYDGRRDDGYSISVPGFQERKVTPFYRAGLLWAADGYTNPKRKRGRNAT